MVAAPRGLMGFVAGDLFLELIDVAFERLHREFADVFVAAGLAAQHFVPRGVPAASPPNVPRTSSACPCLCRLGGVLPDLGGTMAHSAVFSCGWQRSAEKRSHQFVTTQARVVGHAPQHSVQGANLQRIVRRDSGVMLAAPVGCKADVAAGLMVHLITQPGEGLDQVAAGQIARQPHGAITSSRTK